MTPKNLPILPGTVEFLTLGGLVHGGRMHGFELLRWIADRTEGTLLLEEGALYPALHRMEKRGWLTSDWATSEKGRRAKYYSVSSSGRKALLSNSGDWKRYVGAVEKVVGGEVPA